MRSLVRRNRETGINPANGGTLTRWDPWGDFDRVRQEMESLFGNTFGGNTFMDGFTHNPSMELYEDNAKFYLNAYVPGLKPEEINLEVLPDSVHIWGETQSTIPEKDVRVHVAQRTHGQFDLRYSLPTEIDAEKVQANYDNGVLKVELPKVETVKPKTVQVKIGSAVQQ